MSMIYFNGRPQLMLHYAVRTCNAAYVSWILRLSNARDDIDMVDENGQTALTTALITGANLGIVDLLVRGGAYVSIEDLLFAARRINTNLLRKLCDGNRTHGQVINRTDVHGWNALQRAIAENLGNRTVLALLENGADPIPVDPSGWTVLLRAISNNRDSNVVSTLLTKNADPNASDPDSWTALHAAVRYNREYIIIAALLRRGADPNAINPDGKTALCAALDQKLCCITIYALVIAGGNVDITDSKGYTVLHRVIMIKGRSNSSIIFIKCLLIAAATDCNAPTRDGKTALHLHAIYGGGGAAASSEDVVDIFYNLRHIFGTGHTNGIESRFGDGSLVSALIHAGAAVNLIDLEGATPLYYAAGAGNLSIVEALLRRNAEPNLTDKNLVFPLHIALKCHYKEVFETLLLAGANVNAFNAEGCNPLHLAVTMKGGNDFINILIRHNCDVDLRNREGATGLHLAATRGNSANIDVLLDANANANIQDHNGMTPLHYSISTHYSAAMASLESLFRTGFDMHITDRHEMTALHRALVIKADLNIIYRLIRRDPTQVNFD